MVYPCMFGWEAVAVVLISFLFSFGVGVVAEAQRSNWGRFVVYLRSREKNERTFDLVNVAIWIESTMPEDDNLNSTLNQTELD